MGHAGNRSSSVGSFSAVAGAAMVLAACGGGGGDGSSSGDAATNAKPTVTLSAPTLTQAEAPASLTLKATASDSDGSIAKVEFFDGTTLLGAGVLTAGSYQLAVAQTAGKTFNVTAKATDDKGASTTTAAQSVTLDPNPLTAWSNLSAAQKAGVPDPDKALMVGAELGNQFLTVMGSTTVNAKFPGAMSQALRNLATLAPTEVKTHNCENAGGTLQVLDLGNGSLRYNYANCKIGLFTYNGPDTYVHHNTTAQPNRDETIQVSVVRKATANGFTIEPEGLQVTGNGAPLEGGEAYPWNAFGHSVLACTGTGAAQKCTTTYNDNFFWGYDLAWTDWVDNGHATIPVKDDYSLSGTYRSVKCETTCPVADLSPNFRFFKVTRSTGRAIAYATGGQFAEIHRKSAPADDGSETLEITRYTPTAQPTETFKCTLNTAGDWGLLPVTGGGCVLQP